MNRKLRSLLQECFASGNPEGWLKAHPEYRDALLPYLQLDTTLSAQSRLEPSPRGFQEGRRRLFNAVALQTETGRARGLKPLLQVATILAVAVMALGVAAGASALSGHSAANDVLSMLGISSGIEDSNASERASECASGNASLGSGNAQDTSTNAAKLDESGHRCESRGGAQDSWGDEQGKDNSGPASEKQGDNNQGGNNQDGNNQGGNNQDGNNQGGNNQDGNNQDGNNQDGNNQSQNEQ